MEALDLNDSSSAEENIPNEDDIMNGEWDIDFDKEKILWKEFCIKKFIYSPNLCPLCKHNTFRINEKTKKRCSFICNVVINLEKKGNLRNYSFLKFDKIITARIKFEVATLFVLKNKNSNEIKNNLQIKYKRIPYYIKIYKYNYKFKERICRFHKILL